ncbi:MAG: protoglobin domain-containing protein [Planctomycetota bacterium]
MGSIKEFLRYADIADTDVTALRAAKPVVERYADAFVERFYGYLLEFEGTRAFISNPAVLKRLLDAQRWYLLSLFDAKFDSAYYDQRCLIGQTHFRVGLDFKWYVGAYGLYLNYFSPIFDAHFADDPTQRRAIQAAYQRVLLMDMAIVLESFHQRDKAALEMSKDQVLHQEKLATVGLLVSGLAHEIGNPLASIQAICDSQLRKPIEPVIAERFTRIRTQVVRIVNIVGQLINFARPAPAVWTPVDINAVIESALEIARLARNAKSVEVKLQFDRTLPLIDALSEQLSQVFLNLFLNAMDAVGEQCGILEVTTSRQNSHVVVKIQDNGCGISDENLSRIFEPFFSTKDVGKGTGLGLHVSLSIIDRHCGRIQCDSSVGRGTLFTITLPMTQKPESKESA